MLFSSHHGREGNNFIFCIVHVVLFSSQPEFQSPDGWNCRKLLRNFRDYLELQCYKNGMIALHILLHQQMKTGHVKEPSKF